MQVSLHGFVERFVGTDDDAGTAIGRIALGLVMFPHGAQKVFGWFGGHGLSGTVGFMGELGIPGWLALTASLVELVASLMLITGALTRLAALGIAAIQATAVVLVHAPYGFFMNWGGDRAGHGYEFQLLALGLCFVLLARGGGFASVDARLTKQWLSRHRRSFVG